MAKRQLQIISGRSHPKLAEKIANRLKRPLLKTEISNFANGEVRLQLKESVRGDDVFVVQTHAGPNINDAIIEQALIIDAAKRSSAASISAVIPFMGYARQDRKASGREPISARLIIDIMRNSGADRIMTVDLHSGQIQGFFDGPFDHLIARPLLCDYIKNKFNEDELVVVSPDAGRVKSAERYGSYLGCDIAIVHKHRSSRKQKTEAKFLIGDVKGKACLVVDDMIDTGGTICAAADLLKEHDAGEIYGLTTHGVFSDPAVERIEKSVFTQIICTDTLPLPQTPSRKIKSVSIAPHIAEAISAVYDGGSVSKLFKGANQY